MEGTKEMKKIVMIIVMLSAVVLVGTAQIHTEAPINQAIESHQLMRGGAMYEGTVYEPFGTAAPSAYHPVAGEQERTDSERGHVRKGFITPSDPGDQSSEFPLGEAVLPLMLCAVVFGVVIGSRRKKAEKKAKKFAYFKKK